MSPTNPARPLLLPFEGVARPDADTLLSGFLAYTEARGLTLYPAQEEAILEIFDGRSVILNTPTGSGKSLVATAMCWKAVCEHRRVFYTAPIKALVSEKFFDACQIFGTDAVGMMTGDATVNRDAAVVCCTAEILANIALRKQGDSGIDYVVMDEFHYYSDRDRGWAWQVPLLLMDNARFLLMSATLGDTTKFLEGLETLTGQKAALVKSATRPVPLDFRYRETPLLETLQELLEAEQAPIYLVHFAQRAATERAQALTSLDVLSKAEKQTLKEELYGFRFDSPFGKDLSRYLRHGIGVHHAGLLPKYRRLVEKLAQRGLLKIICGTDTLGVGINVPIRTVLFTQLCKYDGRKTAVLSVRDFKQIAGRAGRKGYDDAGTVVAQAPEHVIENLELQKKAAGDPKKAKKMRFKKAPDRGYAHWDAQTFERLQQSDPERLTSSFRVTHGMLLTVLDRTDGRGCQAMKHLLRSSHESRPRKFAHARTAIAQFRSLLAAGVLETTRERGATLVDVNADLQEDFSLHHQLSLYAVDAVKQLDEEAETYPFDLVTVVEATLEDPVAVLQKQLDKRRGEAVAEMKIAGLEYEERMAKLDDVDIHRPNLEFLLSTFETFRKKHPWLRGADLAPKSVARELLEEGMGFNEYVKEYGLSRAEGVLLRYLSDAYKALVQTVPEGAKSDEVYDLTDQLGSVVRGVDSSLIDEWEQLSSPERVVAATEDTKDQDEPRDITRDRRAFIAMVRNEMYRLLFTLSRRRYDDAAELVTAPEGQPMWTGPRIEKRMRLYFDEYDAIRTDPAARSPHNTLIEEDAATWRVRQILVDPEDHLEWSLEALIHLDQAREAGRPLIELQRIAGGASET